jgi:hypothetical protein
MKIQAPEIIYIVLASLSLGITAVKNGEPRKGKINFAAVIISQALTFGILYWGGFFS